MCISSPMLPCFGLRFIFAIYPPPVQHIKYILAWCLIHKAESQIQLTTPINERIGSKQMDAFSFCIARVNITQNGSYTYAGRVSPKTVGSTITTFQLGKDRLTVSCVIINKYVTFTNWYKTLSVLMVVTAIRFYSWVCPWESLFLTAQGGREGAGHGAPPTKAPPRPQRLRSAPASTLTRTAFGTALFSGVIR